MSVNQGFTTLFGVTYDHLGLPETVVELDHDTFIYCIEYRKSRIAEGARPEHVVISRNWPEELEAITRYSATGLGGD